MMHFRSGQRRDEEPIVPVAIRAALRSCAMTIALSAALGVLAGKHALAGEPCCSVVGIAANGQVTARERNGTHTLVFHVSDAAVLRSLKPGAPVYANFETKQVSLDGKRACCTILKVDVGVKPTPVGAADPRNKPSGTAATTRQTTVEVPKVEVTAAESSTATAIRGKPATAATETKQPAAAPTMAAAGAQTAAIDPDVIALQTAADLVARDLGLTSLGEVAFTLVNRGQLGINVPAKPAASNLGVPAPSANPPGAPISIDIWIGSSKMTVQQQSMTGLQSKIFTVPMPSSYPAPRCLDTRDLKVVIDPQNQIAELYDNNNVLAAPNSARPCPDLAIKSIERHHTGLLNETYRVKVTIINQGNAPSPSTQVWGTSLPGGVWPVTGWPELSPTHTIPALGVGESTSFKTGGSVLSANHTAVRVILDRFFQIEESDESNNFQDKRL